MADDKDEGTPPASAPPPARRGRRAAGATAPASPAKGKRGGQTLAGRRRATVASEQSVATKVTRKARDAAESVESAAGAVKDAAVKAPAKAKRVVRKAASKVEKSATPRTRKRVILGAVAAVASVAAGIFTLERVRKAESAKPRTTPATPPVTSTAPHQD